MVTIYVSKLECDKYYIGKTDSSDIKLNDCITDKNEWIDKYYPIEIIDLFRNCESNDVDKITVQYIEFYGIDNVRGGSFTHIILDKHELKKIQKLILTSTNKCYRCGRIGHLTSGCNEITTYDGKQIEISNLYTYHKQERYYGDNGIRCSKCHKTGHISTQCKEVVKDNNVIKKEQHNDNSIFSRSLTLIGKMFKFIKKN